MTYIHYPIERETESDPFLQSFLITLISLVIIYFLQNSVSIVTKIWDWHELCKKIKVIDGLKLKL